MGVMMILTSQLDGLDGVNAEATSAGIRVTGDFDAAREFLDEGYYALDERGMTPEGEDLAYVVSEGSD